MTNNQLSALEEDKSRIKLALDNMQDQISYLRSLETKLIGDIRDLEKNFVMLCNKLNDDW